MGIPLPLNFHGSLSFANDSHNLFSNSIQETDSLLRVIILYRYYAIVMFECESASGDNFVKACD